jgi:hypothetical protein
MAGLLLENGVLRVGTRAILEGVSPRFELETVRDDRVRSDCTGELVRDLDPTHVGVLSLGENANGPSGAHRADPISRHVVQIASRLPTTSRFVANARCKLWWMTPTWGGSECGSIPPETQFLLLEIGGGEGGGGGATGRADASAPTEKKTSGRRKKEKKEKPGTAYVAFLPLISADGFRATLSGHALDAKTAREQSGEGGDGRPLCLVAESGDAATTCSKADSILCVAVASSPFEAAEAVVAAASRRTRTFGLRVDKVVPPTAEVFGWCTWDAFYHSVTPAGVEAGVASLASGGTPARFVIVDDGWQSVTPDAAYRKKVDHISDHPPGSPFRSADAEGLRRSASLPATPSKSDLFQTTETPERSVLPFGGCVRCLRSVVSRRAGERVARAFVALVPRARRRFRRLRANTRKQNDAAGARHAVGGEPASPRKLFARQVSFETERVSFGVDRGAPRQRPHRERHGHSFGRRAGSCETGAHTRSERAGEGVVADARGGVGRDRDGFRVGIRVLARRALEPVPGSVVALVQVPGAGRAEPRDPSRGLDALVLQPPREPDRGQRQVR